MTTPPAGARFLPPPAVASNPKHYRTWASQFSAWIGANETLELFKSPATSEISRFGESERDFRARLQQTSREARDRAVDALRRKYAPKQAVLDERLRRAQQALSRESEQASGQALQTAISMGATLLGTLFGRKIGERGHPRPCDDRSTRRRSLDQGIAGYRACEADRCSRRSRTAPARGRARWGNSGNRPGSRCRGRSARARDSSAEEDRRQHQDRRTALDAAMTACAARAPERPSRPVPGWVPKRTETDCDRRLMASPAKNRRAMNS